MLELNWERTPGQWITVAGSKAVVGEKALRDVAESVTSTPSTVGPSLKMPCQRRPGPGLHDRPINA
jgi:hypothetical protein